MKKDFYFWLDLGGVVFESTGKSNLIIDWSIINTLNNQLGHQLNVGNATLATFLEIYNELTHQNLNPAEFLAAIFDTLTFNQSLIQFLQSYGKIIIVSDNYRENIEFISRRYQFSEWAWKQFYSYDFGLEKSNPYFFQQLLEQLPSISKNQILYIDDSPSKIQSAAQQGIQGILHSNNHNTIAAIKQILDLHKTITRL